MISLLRRRHREATDGNLCQAVWQPGGICIPLLRPHGHPRAHAAPDATGAHRAFLSRCPWDVCNHERGAAPTDGGVPLVRDAFARNQDIATTSRCLSTECGFENEARNASTRPGKRG